MFLVQKSGFHAFPKGGTLSRLLSPRILFLTLCLSGCRSTADQPPTRLDGGDPNLGGHTADEFVALIELLERQNAPMDFLYEAFWSLGSSDRLLGLAEQRPIHGPKIVEFLLPKLESADPGEAVSAARLLAALEEDADIFNRVAERTARSLTSQWWRLRGEPPTAVISVVSSFKSSSIGATRFEQCVLGGHDPSSLVYAADLSGGALGVVLTFFSDDKVARSSMEAQLRDHLSKTMGIKSSDLFVSVVAVPSREPD